MTDFLADGEAKDHLAEAPSLTDRRKFLSALVAVRQALYVEIEFEYAVSGWKDIGKDQSQGLMAAMSHGGRKALYWTRNKEWIEENVKEPIDYVQVDHERLRLDAMEWGVNTAELENLRRLTSSESEARHLANGRMKCKDGRRYRRFAEIQNRFKDRCIEDIGGLRCCCVAR